MALRGLVVLDLGDVVDEAGVARLLADVDPPHLILPLAVRPLLVFEVIRQNQVLLGVELDGSPEPALGRSSNQVVDGGLALTDHPVSVGLHLLLELGPLFGLGQVGSAQKSILPPGLLLRSFGLLDLDPVVLDGFLLVVEMHAGLLVLLDLFLVVVDVDAAVLAPLLTTHLLYINTHSLSPHCHQLVLLGHVHEPDPFVLYPAVSLVNMPEYVHFGLDLEHPLQQPR